jgi:hypothetical protein
LARLPTRRLAPHAQKHLLRNVFSFGGIAQHAPRDTDHLRQMTAHKRFGSALIARSRAPDEVCVRIDHATLASIALRWSFCV